MGKRTHPEPVAVTTVCSVCGLGWELHGPDPTTDDCIRLLKAEVARRSAVPITYPVPYPVYPRQYPVYPRPTITWGQATTGIQGGVAYNTPRTIESTCNAVTA